MVDCILNVSVLRTVPAPLESNFIIAIAPTSPGLPGLLTFVLTDADIIIGMLGVLFNVYKPELVLK